jgi:hypothetical protein
MLSDFTAWMAVRVSEPGFVRRAGFHGRQDVNQSRMSAAFLENALDQFLLARIVAANKLDFLFVFGGQFLSVFPDFIAEWLGKARVIENPNIVSIQIAGHSVCMAESGESSLDDNAVVTFKNTGDLVGVSIGDQIHGIPPWYRRIDSCEHHTPRFGFLLWIDFNGISVLALFFNSAPKAR